MMQIRDLTTLEDFARVVAMEKTVWGYTDSDDVVGVPILVVTVKRGGILLGAFDDRNEMVGFVYSLPAIRDGRLIQWSHMLAVLPGRRASGVGTALKLVQRERALAMGIDLIEWTVDPLQALNAHLNFAKLGVVVREYEENVYGDSSSPLHRGTPTDRFVAEWWLERQHVLRRIAPPSEESPRAREVFNAPQVNRTRGEGQGLECTSAELGHGESRLFVEIPTSFTEMMERRPDAALAWRLKTREIFEAYFGRGYRAVDFFLDRDAQVARYLLAVEEPDV
jgi:predicted GNAT superfamily acetyltransferase